MAREITQEIDCEGPQVGGVLDVRHVYSQPGADTLLGVGLEMKE